MTASFYQEGTRTKTASVYTMSLQRFVVLDRMICLRFYQRLTIKACSLADSDHPIVETRMAIISWLVDMRAHG